MSIVIYSLTIEIECNGWYKEQDGKWTVYVTTGIEYSQGTRWYIYMYSIGNPE